MGPAVVAAALVALSLTGCGSGAGGEGSAAPTGGDDATAEGPTSEPTSEDDGQEADGSATVVRVGTTSVTADAQVCLAMEKGYYQEEGLEVEIVPFKSSADQIASLGTGDLDVGGGAAGPGLYNAVASGVDLRAVADRARIGEDFSYFALMVRGELVENGTYTDFSDLGGMNVASYSEGSSTTVALSEFLAAGGLSLDDVNLTYLGSADQPAALDNGAIDASLGVEPIVTQMEAEGFAVPVARSNEVYPNQQGSVLLYSGAFADSDSDAPVAFMRAYVRAARDYKSALDNGRLTGSGAQELAEAIADCVGTDVDTLTSVMSHDIHPDVAMNVDSMAADRQWYIDEGIMEESAATVEDVIDTSFAEQAVSSLDK